MMTDDSLDTLRGFVETIANSERDLESLGGPVLHYGLFLRRILNSTRAGFKDQREIQDETKSSSGGALSPWHAAACMDDRTRTAAFIRGSIRAVQSTLDRCCSLRPLHLLEAGCGPLGTLVLPLLAHFKSDELVVSLIDLHEESIECIGAMLDHFGFLPRTRQLIHGDATTVPTHSSVQVILTETMNTALSREPQVAISRALMREHRDAILIPQSIRVELALLDIAAETSQFPAQVGERTVLGPVFELNRQTALELVVENGVLPASTVKIPDAVPPGAIPCLTTNIQVFEETQIRDYETQISCPVPLQQAGQVKIAPGAALQFAYEMGDSPGLVWNQIDRGSEPN